MKLPLADAGRVGLDEFDCFSSVDDRCIQVGSLRIAYPMLMTPFSLREICCRATTGGEQINALWWNGMAPPSNGGRGHAIASVITMMRDSGAFCEMGSKGMTMTLRYSFAGAVALTVLASAA